MDFKRISGQAKKLIDQRGGTESLKGDLEELKTIAKGKGSLADKAKAAGAALKEPGQRGAEAKDETGGPIPRPGGADAEPTTTAEPETPPPVEQTPPIPPATPPATN
jgi:hypothetical protein